MKFSKRGKTRIKIPATNDTSGESAINIKREWDVFVCQENRRSAGGVYSRAMYSFKAPGKRASTALVYANSTTHSFKGALA